MEGTCQLVGRGVSAGWRGRVSWCLTASDRAWVVLRREEGREEGGSVGGRPYQDRDTLTIQVLLIEIPECLQSIFLVAEDDLSCSWWSNDDGLHRTNCIA